MSARCRCLSAIFSVSGDGRRCSWCADRWREQVSAGGVDTIFGRHGRGRRDRGRRLRGGGGGRRRWRSRGRRRVRTVTATTGDRCCQRRQNDRTSHDAREANWIKGFHDEISNRFGLVAVSLQWREGEPLEARFIDAAVVAVIKLARAAISTAANTMTASTRRPTSATPSTRRNAAL